MKRSAAIFFALLMMFSLVACSSDSDEDSDKDSSAETIAFFVKTPNNPFFVTMMKGAQDSADEHGVEIYLDGPQAETDIQAQVAMVENAIAQGVCAIVIAPCDKTSLIPALVLAHEAGIPVINVDDFIDKDEVGAAGGQILAFIGSDNFAGGKLAGAAMGKLFEGQGNVKVAIIEGMAGVPNSILRYTGFAEALNSYPNVEIVFSQPGDWDTQKGYDQTTNALTAHPDLAGVFCCNDQMALGALAAAEELGRDDLVIIGYDANTDAVERVVAGDLHGTVAQYPYDMGRQGVDAAVKAMNGESLQEKIATLILFIDQSNAQDQLDGKLG